jgi:hypothetical protein
MLNDIINEPLIPVLAARESMARALQGSTPDRPVYIIRAEVVCENLALE